MPCEEYPVFCNFVNVGSLNPGLAVTPKLAVTKVVSQNIDDIWPGIISADLPGFAVTTV